MASKDGSVGKRPTFLLDLLLMGSIESPLGWPPRVTGSILSLCAVGMTFSVPETSSLGSPES